MFFLLAGRLVWCAKKAEEAAKEEEDQEKNEEVVGKDHCVKYNIVEDLEIVWSR